VWRKQYRQAFIDVMRTPKVQSMFVQGIPKDSIISYVWKNMQPEIHASMERNSSNVDFVTSMRKLSKATSSRVIHSSRDIKYTPNFGVEEDEVWFDDVPLTAPVVPKDPILIEQRRQRRADKKKAKREATDEEWNEVTPTSIDVIGFAKSITKEKVYDVLETPLVKSDGLVAYMSNNPRKTRNIITALVVVVCVVNLLLAQVLGIWSTPIHVASAIYSYKAVERHCWTLPIIGAKAMYTSDVKVQLLNIKTVIHAVYHALCGEYAQSLEWLTNYVVTQPNLTSYLPTLQDIRVFATSRATEFSSFYNANNQHVEPTSFGSMSTFMNIILKIIANTGAIDMSEKDLKFANIQYQYVNHRFKELSDAKDCALAAISFICRLTIGVDPCDQGQQEFIVKLYNTTRRIESLVSTPSAELNNVVSNEEIVAFWRECQDIKSSIHYQTMCQAAQTHFHTRYVQMQNLANEAISSLNFKEKRVAPLCVLFTGPPKTGKTAATEHALRILSYLEKIEDSDMQKYAYTAESEYWEGYMEQPFVIMDDFGKHTDIQVRAKEAADVINMVNTSRFALNMAFEKKGKTFFNSKYLFINTNMMNEGMKACRLELGLTDPEAFKRRCHVVIHATTKLSEGMKLMDHPYEIQVCSFKPEYENRKISAKELPILLKEMRDIQLKLHAGHQMSAEEIQSIYGPSEDITVPTFMDALTVTPTTDDLVVMRPHFHIEPEHLDTLQEYILMDVKDVTKKALIALVATALLTGMGVAAYKYIFPTAAFEETSKIIKANLPGTMKFSGSVKEARKPQWNRYKRVPNFHATSGLPSDHIYPQTKNWVGRMVGVGYDENGTKVSNGAVAWRLCDRYFVTCAHFFDKLNVNDVQFQFCWNGANSQLFTIPDDDVTLYEGKDIAIFKMPNCVPNLPRELISKIFSAGDPTIHKSLGLGHPAHLVTVNEDGATHPKTVSTISDISPLAYAPFGATYVVEHPIKFTPATALGDSGSPLVIRGSQGELIIVGIQCGNINKPIHAGMAMSLNRETINAFMEHTLGLEHGEEPTPVDVEPTSNTFPFTDYTVSNEPCPVNRKSNIKKTKLHGYHGPSNYVPARFTPFVNDEGEYVDPLYRGISKMTQEPFGKVKVHQDVFNYLDKYYRRLSPGRLLTDDEALNGSSEYGYPPIEYGTSPGYPYNLNKAKGKSGYIMKDILTGQMTLHQEVRDAVLRCEDELRQGRQITVYWADFMKDETREYKKARDGKTRIVSSCPLHYLLILRKYFMDFVAHVQRLASKSPISVGINCHSIQHYMLYERLSRTAGSVIAGDFSNYDGRLPGDLGNYFVQYVNRWYDDGEVNARVRQLLVEHINRATHICGAYVYRVEGGNPSGNPITSIYNSMCNIFMCYTILVDCLHMKEEQFQIAVYGDDNIITTTTPGLRASTFTPWFKQLYGMTYTHYTKEESDVYDTLFTIRYLGRKFWFDERGHMRAPLDLTVIRESLYWFKTKADREIVLQSMYDAALTEFSHHGEQVFREERDLLLENFARSYPELYECIRMRTKTYHAIIDTMYH